MAAALSKLAKTSVVSLVTTESLIKPVFDRGNRRTTMVLVSAEASSKAVGRWDKLSCKLMKSFCQANCSRAPKEVWIRREIS